MEWNIGRRSLFLVQPYGKDMLGSYILGWQGSVLVSLVVGLLLCCCIKIYSFSLFLI